MKSYLNLAAKIAINNANKNNFRKNSLLGAIAIRKDGTKVCSDNNTTIVPKKEAHAEARVLRKAGHGSTLFVARMTRDGDWACAKPCKDCRTIIKNRGVYKVVYTIAPGEFGIWYPGESKNP